MTSHDGLHTWIAERQREFLDRTGLGGLLDSASVPAVYRVASRSTLQRIATNGRAALVRLCERSGVESREDLAVRLPVLALAPHLAFDIMPGVLGPDPRVIADVRAYALAILEYDPGARLELRAGLIEQFPPDWRAVLNVLASARKAARSGRGKRDKQGKRDKSGKRKEPRGAARPFNAGLALALLAIGRGMVRTADLPAQAPLAEWAAATSWNARRVEDWRYGLRGIADLQRTAAGRKSLDACPALAVLVARLATADFLHLRAAPRTLEWTVAELGLKPPATTPEDSVEDGNIAADAAADVLPPDLTAGQRAMLETLRVYAPHFHALVLCPRVTSTGEVEPLRAATLRHVLECVDHHVAAYARLRPLLATLGVRVYELHELTPAALLHERVPARLLTIAPPAVRYSPGVAAMLAQTAFAAPAGEPTVPLLHLLLDRQAEASRARSPAARGETGSGRAAPGYTKALAASAKTFQHAFDRWVQTTTYPGTAERVHLAGLLDAARRVTRDVATGVTKGVPCKQPERLLALLTLPQLVCLGLPRLTAYLLEAYRGFCAAGRARDLPQEFVHLVESCFVTAVFAADTLRVKNWQFARVGHEIRLSRVGREANAQAFDVYSRFTGRGGDNIPAALKIKYDWVPDASGRRRRHERTREHRWSPAVVTPELMTLYLSVLGSGKRAPNEAAAGRGPTFPPRGAPLLTAAKQPGKRLSRKQLCERVARVLHWVCREVLGRALEPWETFCRTRGREYYGLFGPHVLRALQATYWLGVRERDVIGAGLSAAESRAVRAAKRVGFDALGKDTATYAMHLLNDRRPTLERDYVHLTPESEARRHTSPDTLPRERRWEHERAHDRWMDLVAIGVPVAWHRQIGLPLPPGLRLRDLDPGSA